VVRAAGFEPASRFERAALNLQLRAALLMQSGCHDPAVTAWGDSGSNRGMEA
jgi:hypothetical protein